MKWVRYESDGKTFYGIITGDSVREVYGTPFDAYTESETVHSYENIHLLPPVIPPTFYAAGVNYETHVREAAALLGREPNIPNKADIGYRAVNAIIGHDDPIIIPSDATEKVQYEGELVVVIGKEAKHLTEENALDCVLGYTVGNDVSERSWQASDRTLWRAKNTDTFKPMGPWIETDVDFGDMYTTVRLNDKTVSNFDTTNMVFSIAKYISAMTRNLTLFPGDVIWMGTDGATRNIKAGDVVEVDISGIGSLRNPVVKE